MHSSPRIHKPPARSIRKPARLLAGAFAFGLPALFAGTAHAASGDDLPQASSCDAACVLALSDSDGDGYSNLYELAVGTDPLDPYSRPSYEDTIKLLEDGRVIRVRFDVDGHELFTAANGIVYDVDLKTQPDGSELVVSELVDPKTGGEITRDQFGLGVKDAGIDLPTLVDAIRKDPSAIDALVTNIDLPAEKPDWDPNARDPYAEEDPEGGEGGEGEAAPAAGPAAGGEEEPPAGEQPEEGEDTPADTPPESPVEGPEEGPDGQEVAKRELPTFCNQGDPCPPGGVGPYAPPKEPVEPSYWQQFKCWLGHCDIKGHNHYTAEPEGEAPLHFAPSPIEDTPVPYAPEYLHPDGQEQPGTDTTQGDNTLILTTGDSDTPLVAGSGSGAATGVFQGPVVAPMDPPDPLDPNGDRTPTPSPVDPGGEGDNPRP